MKIEFQYLDIRKRNRIHISPLLVDPLSSKRNCTSESTSNISKIKFKKIAPRSSHFKYKRRISDFSEWQDTSKLGKRDAIIFISLVRGRSYKVYVTEGGRRETDWRENGVMKEETDGRRTEGREEMRKETPREIESRFSLRPLLLSSPIRNLHYHKIMFSCPAYQRTIKRFYRFFFSPPLR